jgi:type I restriction enzyme, S subunit
VGAETAVMLMNFPPGDFGTYKLDLGDVLLSEASGSISDAGKFALWEGQIENCCFHNTVIRVV